MSATIHQEVSFKASPDRVYDILLSSEQFSKVTGRVPTDINSEEGGMILGRNIELIPNKRIVQAWRVANWEDGVYSIVKFELKEQGSETVLVFDHSGFPEGQDEHLASGWQTNYWGPIEKLLA